MSLGKRLRSAGGVRRRLVYCGCGRCKPMCCVISALRVETQKPLLLRSLNRPRCPKRQERMSKGFELQCHDLAGSLTMALCCE
jgi:hypothetical protein